MTHTKIAFEISRRDLARMLTTALAFASRDDTLPTVSGIHLSIDKGYFVATATDRFRLGLTRILIDDKGIAGKSHPIGLLDLVATKKIIAHLKAPLSEQHLPAQLTVNIDRSTTLTVDTFGSAFTARLKSENFPNYLHLLTNALASTPGNSAVAVNAGYLAAFKVASWQGEHLTVRMSTADRPFVVLCGDHFIGMQMPVRMERDCDDEFTSWTTFLTSAAEPEKPKRAPRKRPGAAVAAKPPTKQAAAKKAATKRAPKAAK